MMQTQKKRCWNCRDRKTACDRTRPGCQKCKERKESCLGYGIKLSWPRENDKRRFTRENGHYLLPVQSSDLEFVNTSAEDIDLSQQLGQIHHSPKSYETMWLSQLPRMTVGRADCAHSPPNGVPPVAQLISSTYEADDLYSLLLRLSINDEEKPTLATRHAISALSYQHLDKDKALVYQTSAICALQSSIEALVPSRAIQTMAASMLLSIFETLNSDTSSLSWTIFFCGTKAIARMVTQLHSTYYGDEALVLDWIFYHDAMYKFSIRHWIDRNDDQAQLAGLTKVISKAVFAPERQTVVPLLGCSLELLDLICQAVDAVFDRDDPRHLSEAHLDTARSLEIRIRMAEQRHTRVSEQAATTTRLEARSHAANVAELYRLAALVYLHRVVRGVSHEAPCVRELVRESFALLDRIQSCERPWPLFVIALEARAEESRRTVLKILDESLRRRPLGNILLTSRMVRDAWVQQDLQNGDIDPLVLYNLVVSRNRVPPSFA